MKVNQRNYHGKQVFVGIDVHKKNYVIVSICEEVVVKKWTTLADPFSLCEQLLRFFPGAKISTAYEAGFSGFSLHRMLVAKGIHSRVVNAGSIEVKSNDKVKTDKRDAKKIAEHLASGRLRGIYVPSEEEEKRRAISRGREQSVERRKTVGNQLKMKLFYLGFNFSDQKISENFCKWAEKLELAAEYRMVISELIHAWRVESQRIKRFNEALKDQAAKDELEKIYRSCPGVGAISARTLSNELGDMKRFDNERQLFSSSGLTPGESSSGEKIRKGHISRQGSSRLRAVMMEVAWRAITQDESLRAFYTLIFP